ncbi:hypothetical protein HERIO_2435 [Hepatospora eriocheir]|uniref:Uncharacterized protein n=1 Tax=Hepatospora eriocheir TaxID=1081669 RepID=A0A1X0Q6Y5_9MICR|nr:hypothetical protein HERIO_2435 [Hepatospora eriocheir]
MDSNEFKEEYKLIDKFTEFSLLPESFFNDYLGLIFFAYGLEVDEIVKRVEKRIKTITINSQKLSKISPDDNIKIEAGRVIKKFVKLLYNCIDYYFCKKKGDDTKLDDLYNKQTRLLNELKETNELFNENNKNVVYFYSLSDKNDLDIEVKLRHMIDFVEKYVHPIELPRFYFKIIETLINHSVTYYNIHKNFIDVK